MACRSFSSARAAAASQGRPQRREPLLGAPPLLLAPGVGAGEGLARSGEGHRIASRLLAPALPEGERRVEAGLDTVTPGDEDLAGLQQPLQLAGELARPEDRLAHRLSRSLQLAPARVHGQPRLLGGLGARLGLRLVGPGGGQGHGGVRQGRGERSSRAAGAPGQAFWPCLLQQLPVPLLGPGEGGLLARLFPARLLEPGLERGEACRGRRARPPQAVGLALRALHRLGLAAVERLGGRARGVGVSGGTTERAGFALDERATPVLEAERRDDALQRLLGGGERCLGRNVVALGRLQLTARLGERAGAGLRRNPGLIACLHGSVGLLGDGQEPLQGSIPVGEGLGALS